MDEPLDQRLGAAFGRARGEASTGPWLSDPHGDLDRRARRREGARMRAAAFATALAVTAVVGGWAFHGVDGSGDGPAPSTAPPPTTTVVTTSTTIDCPAGPNRPDPCAMASTVEPGAPSIEFDDVWRGAVAAS